MRRYDGAVRTAPPGPDDDRGWEDVDAAIRLYERAGSYDEYVLLCTAEGVEPLFTRAEFDAAV